jgi:hypothetical protein
LLFERGNAADLAEQMMRVSQEPGLLAQLRAAIPAVRAIDQEVAETAHLYTQVLGSISLG